MQKFSHPKSIPHGDSPGYGESCDNLIFWLLSWARGQVVKKLKIKVQKHAKKKIFEIENLTTHALSTCGDMDPVQISGLYLSAKLRNQPQKFSSKLP